MAAIGEDLIVEFVGEERLGAPPARFLAVQADGCQRDGDQPVDAVGPLHGAGERKAHPLGQTRDVAQEAFVEGVVGALQQQRRMGEEGDQPSRRHGRAPGDVAAVVALDDEFLDQTARVGTCDGGVGGAHMAQPAETVKRFRPGLGRWLDIEGRFAMGPDRAAGEGIIARIEVASRGRVGGAQVMRSEKQAGGRFAAEGPEPACRADELATRAPRRPSDRGLGQSPTLRPGAQIAESSVSGAVSARADHAGRGTAARCRANPLPVIA